VVWEISAETSEVELPDHVFDVAGGAVQVVHQPSGELRLRGVAPLQEHDKGMGGKKAAEQLLAEPLVELFRHFLPECPPMPCHA